MKQLPCMNCQKPVEPSSAKTFAGVFVCPVCFLTAERLEQRATQELKALLTMQREAIRIALIERRLVLGPAEPLRDLSKKEVLEQVLQLAEKANAHRTSTGVGYSKDQPQDTGGDGAEVRAMGS